MRLLLTGGLSRAGIALALSWSRRGHVVTVAERAERLDAGAVRTLWRRRPLLELGSAPAEALRKAAAHADALVLIGDSQESAWDVDLTLAALDAAGTGLHPMPIIRLADLPARAGAEDESTHVRQGLASYRDLPHGIPEERTLQALDEADRAFRIATTIRDAPAVLLRSAEILDPSLLEGGIHGVAQRWIYDLADDPQSSSALHGDTTFDLVSAELVCEAIEHAAHRAARLRGRCYHICGGTRARASAQNLAETLAGALVGDRPPAPRFLGSVPAAHVLDDARSRAALEIHSTLDAPSLVERVFRSLRRAKAMPSSRASMPFPATA